MLFQSHRLPMQQDRLYFKPGSLWPALVRQTDHALRCGVVQPIETEQRIIEDCGVRFLVRIVSSLAHKGEALEKQLREQPWKKNEPSAKKDEAADPFVDYDLNLFVADISSTHVALLNKFNVLERHLLIVTREFQHQETLLGRQDFEALAACMVEFEGLGFYNAGRAAGASQTHKHLQMVPLPLGSEGPAIPIEPLLNAAPFSGSIAKLPALPFAHAFARLDPAFNRDTLSTAAHQCYRDMVKALGLHTAANETRQSAPYNLLVTRRWMLLVPRSEECFDSISVNALGFAGSFFVRNQVEMRTIEEHGPIAVLLRVAVKDRTWRAR
jgi:ATP adenylyltransferase